MENEKIIVEFLRKKMNNEYAIFGILGNIIAESNAQPNNVENGRQNNGDSYGNNGTNNSICNWNNSVRNNNTRR